MVMKKCVDALQKAKRIFLLSHIHPDGDSIGSLLAIYYAFCMNKEVYIISKSNIPEVFQYLINDQNKKIIADNPPTSIEDHDILITLDVNDKNRTEYPELLENFAENDRLFAIDHHPGGNIVHLANESLIEIEASSTAELVYLFLRSVSIKITPTIARCLLTGIYTDTGGFQFENTTPRALSIVSELLKMGAQISQIEKQMNPSKSIQNLRLIGLVLKRVFISNDCAISYLTLDDQIKLKSSENDLLGIANQINTLNNTKLSLLLIQTNKNLIRGMLRTKNKLIDLSKIAYVLGGGGHPRAAGFTIRGNLQEFEKKLVIEK